MVNVLSANNFIVFDIVLVNSKKKFNPGLSLMSMLYHYMACSGVTSPFLISSGVPPSVSLQNRDIRCTEENLNFLAISSMVYLVLCNSLNSASPFTLLIQALGVSPKHFLKWRMNVGRLMHTLSAISSIVG